MTEFHSDNPLLSSAADTAGVPASDGKARRVFIHLPLIERCADDREEHSAIAVRFEQYERFGFGEADTAKCRRSGHGRWSRRTSGQRWGGSVRMLPDRHRGVDRFGHIFSCRSISTCLEFLPAIENDSHEPEFCSHRETSRMTCASPNNSFNYQKVGSELPDSLSASSHDATLRESMECVRLVGDALHGEVKVRTYQIRLATRPDSPTRRRRPPRPSRLGPAGCAPSWRAASASRPWPPGPRRWSPWW